VASTFNGSFNGCILYIAGKAITQYELMPSENSIVYSMVPVGPSSSSAIGDTRYQGDTIIKYEGQSCPFSIFL